MWFTAGSRPVPTLPSVMTAKRSTTLLLTAGLALAACGGGDNARQVLEGSGDSAPATDSVPATDPVETDPPATDPPATDPPPTDPPATDPAVSDPPSSDPVGGDLSAFCGASSQFYVEAQALNEIEADDDAAAEALFGRMQISLPAALLNSPSEEMSAAPRRVEEVFAVLIPALDTLGYNFDDLSSLDNPDEVSAAFIEFVEVVDQLRIFLVDTCEADLASLDDEAATLAADVGTVAPTPTDGDPGSDDLGALEVTDVSGTITVTVPASWTDVVDDPQGELRRLVAAPDAAAFLAGFTDPGMILLVGDVAAGAGADEAATRFDGLETSVTEAGCSPNFNLPYDDGVYVGDESIYSCADATVRLAGGTNDSGDLFWLLAVVYGDGEDETWSLIADSFLVD